MPILAQLVQRYLPGCKIELAADEKIKAREFSYSAQSCLLMLGQLAYWCIKWAKHRQRGREAAHGRERGEHASEVRRRGGRSPPNAWRGHQPSRSWLGSRLRWPIRYRGLPWRNRLKENFRQVHCVCQYNLL